MLPEEENDPRITGLFDTRLKIPGMKVVTVQPIAYDDELFGNKLQIVSIDIKQEIKEEIIPDDDTPTPTTSNHQELYASQQYSDPNQIQFKANCQRFFQHRNLMNYKFTFHSHPVQFQH